MTEQHSDSMYVHGKCRCDICRKLHTERGAANKAKRKKLPSTKIPHGLNGYRNYSCRCVTCVEANMAYEQGIDLEASRTFYDEQGWNDVLNQ
jgi:hypothetical protein